MPNMCSVWGVLQGTLKRSCLFVQFFLGGVVPMNEKKGRAQDISIGGIEKEQTPMRGRTLEELKILPCNATLHT